MSKKSHQKELERARAKRAAAAASTRSRRTRIVAMVVIAAMALSVFALAFAAGNRDPGEDAQASSTVDEVDPGAEPTTATDDADAPEPCPTDVAAPEVTAEPYDAVPEMTIDASKVYVATIETTCGTITMELQPEWAPNAVNNFVMLARDGYYTGVPFHRVIDDFMIQGGDPTGTGTGEGRFPGYTFAEETGRAEELVAESGVYPRGTVAMAKTAAPASSGSQFFIVQADGGWPPNPGPTYTVFGDVLEGLDVVDRIAVGPADGGIAVDPVRMISVTIEERDA